MNPLARRRHPLLAVALLLTSAIPTIAQKENADSLGHQAPPPPPGFVWRTMDYAHGRIPVPQAWHWKAQQTPQSMNYFASVESIDTEGRFKTGMSIWVIRLDHGRDAADFGNRWVGELAKHGAVIDTSSNTTPPFQTSACRIRDTATTDRAPIIIQNMAIANTSTRTIYLIVFESPEATWDEAWRKGQTMLSGLILDPQK